LLSITPQGEALLPDHTDEQVTALKCSTGDTNKVSLMDKLHVWLHGCFLAELLTESRTYPELQVRSKVCHRKQRKFRLNMRKNFFPLRVTEPWPRLPREAVESPSLEIFPDPPGRGAVQPAPGDPAWAGGWAG